MILLTAVILVAVATVSAGELPHYIHVCKRNDPDLAGCISRSVAHIRPYLTNGIPELHVPPIEPLLLQELVAVNGTGIKISAKNLKAYGGGDYQGSNIKTDLDNLVVQADVFYPQLYVNGEYRIDGKILLLPISGSGPMTGNFTECKGKIRMQMEVRKNETGEEYLYCTRFDVKTHAGKGNMHFENLFGGDPTLGGLVNDAINSNFQAFAKEFAPLVEEALSKALKDIANNILTAFSYKQLFPVD